MEMLRETFFVQGLIVSVIAAVLVKLIVWRNYHKLLASSEEMDRPCLLYTSDAADEL